MTTLRPQSARSVRCARTEVTRSSSAVASSSTARGALIVSCAHVWNDAESWCSAKLPAGFLDPAEEGVAIGFSSGPGLPIVWHGRARSRAAAQTHRRVSTSSCCRVTQAFDGCCCRRTTLWTRCRSVTRRSCSPRTPPSPTTTLRCSALGCRTSACRRSCVPSAANSPSSIRSPGGSRRVCRRAVGTVAGQCLGRATRL